MATKKKSRTAAANAARRKQGPTKGTDYKNGRAVTAAAKAKRKKKKKLKPKSAATAGSDLSKKSMKELQRMNTEHRAKTGKGSKAIMRAIDKKASNASFKRRGNFLAKKLGY
jgi:hypothetical protein